MKQEALKTYLIFSSCLTSLILRTFYSTASHHAVHIHGLFFFTFFTLTMGSPLIEKNDAFGQSRPATSVGWASTIQSTTNRTSLKSQQCRRPTHTSAKKHDWRVITNIRTQLKSFHAQRVKLKPRRVFVSLQGRLVAVRGVEVVEQKKTIRKKVTSATWNKATCQWSLSDARGQVTHFKLSGAKIWSTWAYNKGLQTFIKTQIYQPGVDKNWTEGTLMWNDPTLERALEQLRCTCQSQGKAPQPHVPATPNPSPSGGARTIILKPLFD